MRGIRNEDGQREAIRLRVDERLSFREIQDRTGISKSSLSRWLKELPLADEELEAKIVAGVTKLRPGSKKDRGLRSKYHEMVGDRDLGSSAKGNIAEAAVLFRLTLHDLHVMAPVFDGGRTDWLVQVPAGNLVKIQVKWAKSNSEGLPTLSLTCASGHSNRRRYTDEEFDYLVGYDLFTDTAYVFSSSELQTRLTSISIQKEAAERWDKIVNHGVVVQREGTRLAV